MASRRKRRRLPPGWTEAKPAKGSRRGRFIVKVQQPLFSTEWSEGGDPGFYVYPEDRRFAEFIEPPDELRKALGEDPKKYFWATLENGILNIDTITPCDQDQDW